MSENNFEVGQIYKYSDNAVTYSIRIDRVGKDNVYFSTMSPRRIGGGSFHKSSEIAGLLTLSDERDGLLIEKDQRIKELEYALTFTVNALASFFPFCGKDVSKLPTNLDATQYQTCSYDGDKKLLEKFIKCRKLIKREVE